VEATNSPGYSHSTTLCTKKHLRFRKGETKTIKCDADTHGQYVKLSLPGDHRILTLCEVEVYGGTGKSCIHVSFINMYLITAKMRFTLMPGTLQEAYVNVCHFRWLTVRPNAIIETEQYRIGQQSYE